MEAKFDSSRPVTSNPLTTSPGVQRKPITIGTRGNKSESEAAAKEEKTNLIAGGALKQAQPRDRLTFGSHRRSRDMTKEVKGEAATTKGETSVKNKQQKEEIKNKTPEFAEKVAQGIKKLARLVEQGIGFNQKIKDSKIEELEKQAIALRNDISLQKDIIEEFKEEGDKKTEIYARGHLKILKEKLKNIENEISEKEKPRLEKERATEEAKVKSLIKEDIKKIKEENNFIQTVINSSPKQFDKIIANHTLEELTQLAVDLEKATKSFKPGSNEAEHINTLLGAVRLKIGNMIFGM
jgi:hypothetical protein